MQIFFKENLALLAVPKTGSTAYEMALKRRADISFSGRRKHANAAFFHRRIAPFLESAYGLTPERLAVIRDPLDQIRSWYRYRQREALKGSKYSTRGISFDEFVDATTQDDPPPFANVGSQGAFLTLKTSQTVPVHHLFAYEAQDALRAFLEERFGRALKLKEYNVSPRTDAALSPEAEARFRAARALDFRLHDKVMQAGGHLQQLLEE
ncbi:sulfotransferase family 2 domain-containing protein [Marimonas lutisalis]|uniref:sulfotransferase family 2 domain-containing protein n=1 Tax=Marimonas lutisalis TaxID=2545756 RepID=UPI0010F568BA|nr:sulfotransferase family 2 domain-containing protein [Marimonas lutisalis]